MSGVRADEGAETDDVGAFVARIAETLPFNRLLELTCRTARAGYAEVALPGDERMTNHLGSVHAVAELAPAEAAGGIAAASGLADLVHDGWVPIAKRLEVDYRRLANGEVVAICELPEELARSAREAAQAGERIGFVLPIDVRDAEGTVAEVRVEYVFKQRGGS